MTGHFAELIATRRCDLGIGDTALIAAAERAGHTLGRTTVHKFRTKPCDRFPETATMHAFADALDVPYAAVVLAVARDLVGDTPGLDQHAVVFADLVKGRPEWEVDTVLSVARQTLAMADRARDTTP